MNWRRLRVIRGTGESGRRRPWRDMGRSSVREQSQAGEQSHGEELG